MELAYWGTSCKLAPAGDFKKNMLEAIDKLPLTENLAKKFLRTVDNPTSKDLKKYLIKNFEVIFKKID